MIEKISLTLPDGLEPYGELRHILKHMATADTAEKLKALLP